MEMFEAINKRASLKGHISGRDIEEEKITKILEAARMAPSARNSQPWRFIVVRDKEIIKTLADRVFGESSATVVDAPVIIVACANPEDDIVRDGKEYYLFDVGLAVENMLLAATDLGLVTHAHTGVNAEELTDILGIPPEVKFVVTTPLAYPTEASYEEAAQDRLAERTRKDLKELVYTDGWGKTA
ncbi:nitroreductase family protein [Chloroflexota bacterium]